MHSIKFVHTTKFLIMNILTTASAEQRADIEKNKKENLVE